MALPEYFISCDWGTSNFRLSVVRSEDCQIFFKKHHPDGIKFLHKEYLLQQAHTQFEYFSSFIKNQIDHLPAEFQNLIVVVGGMASSNLGLKELPYANLPIEANGKSLFWEELVLGNSLKLLLVSGVQDDCDVMRGEELQAIGVLSHFQNLEKSMLILPGTHSKHIEYSGGKFRHFKTYMTGELFDLLGNQSILSNSILGKPWSASGSHSFVKGVQKGMENLTKHLFGIRVRHILGQASKEENYFHLSGLLIGNELAYLKDFEQTVVLSAPSTVVHLYELALKEILPTQKLIIISEEDYARSTLIGQRKILMLHYGK